MSLNAGNSAFVSPNSHNLIPGRGLIKRHTSGTRRFSAPVDTFGRFFLTPCMETASSYPKMTLLLPDDRTWQGRFIGRLS